MHVQVNTSNGIENKESLERWVNEYLEEHFARFRDDLTRIEVQLRDTNSAKSGADDKRCTLEARITGRDPVAVTHHAESQDEAIRGAATKLVHHLEHVLGKLDRHQHRDRDTIRRDPSAVG